MTHDELVKQMNVWAQRHAIGLDCPACGSQVWDTGSIIDPPQEAGIADARMVQVFCKTCGYLLLFKASVIGV
jgi:predicted nucleic-acid-binding Zn-ribbon protein